MQVMHLVTGGRMREMAVVYFAGTMADSHPSPVRRAVAGQVVMQSLKRLGMPQESRGACQRWDLYLRRQC